LNNDHSPEGEEDTLTDMSGQPLKTVRMSIRLTPADRDLLQTQAQAKHLNVSELIRYWIHQEAKNSALKLTEEQLLESGRDITLATVLAKYITTKRKLKESTIEGYKDLIRLHAPEWQDIPMRSIDSSMILAKHSEVGAKSKARADGLMKIIRALYNFAIEIFDDAITRNPVTRMKAVDAWYKVGRRKSYIPADELNKFIPAVLELRYHSSALFILMMI